jgi:hypothetical protein
VTARPIISVTADTTVVTRRASVELHVYDPPLYWNGWEDPWVHVKTWL